MAQQPLLRGLGAMRFSLLFPNNLCCRSVDFLSRPWRLKSRRFCSAAFTRCFSIPQLRIKLKYIQRNNSFLKEKIPHKMGKRRALPLHLNNIAVISAFFAQYSFHHSSAYYNKQWALLPLTSKPGIIESFVYGGFYYTTNPQRLQKEVPALKQGDFLTLSAPSKICFWLHIPVFPPF